MFRANCVNPTLGFRGRVDMHLHYSFTTKLAHQMPHANEVLLGLSFCPADFL